jgi:signal transduction histidine kinase
MKTNNSQLSTLNFQLLMFVVLLLAASCKFSHKDYEPQKTGQNAAPDSTLITVIDSVNPEWNHKLDRMLQIEATAKQDTTLAKLYFDIGEMYLNNIPDKAKEYYLKSKALSEKLGWSEGIYLFTSGYTDALNREGLMDSSIIIHQQALALAKIEKNERRIATISANLGLCYYYKQWFETALKYYGDALLIFEKRGEKFRLAHIYYLMAIVYKSMKMEDADLTYCEKALNILNEKPDTVTRAQTLVNYAVALYERQQFEKSENCLLEAQRIFKFYNNKYGLMTVYSNLGEIAFRKYDLDKAELYARKSLNISLELDNIEVYCASNLVLAYVEEFKGNLNQSEEYTKKTMETAIKYNLLAEKGECYQQLADLSTARRDFHNYRFYQVKSDSIQKAITSEQSVRATKEMEVKYETEKKELKITALEKEKRLMTGLGIAGGAVLMLALATFFFLWRWTVQKRRIADKQKQLAEQQVKQLEQEKQLVAAQAVLDGETQERARLARDLHDGLGSMLTGVKLNLMEMKKGVTLEYDEVERFDKAIGLLDRSVQEMRRVAHHLMPDSLSRFGLKSAVSDFCQSLASNIVFDYFGDEKRLAPLMEVVIYRSIHELVNNALKYAGAAQIWVQIVQEPNRIAFTVQDDGCGFDPSTETKGTGLQNIRNRIASFGGTIQIDSKPGEGTEVNGELRVMSYEL